jgi:hypothetical protein
MNVRRAKDTSYYSEVDTVHHTEDECPGGRLIPPELRRHGTGGYELCPACRARGEAHRRTVMVPA